MNIENDKSVHEEGLIVRCNQKGNISDVIYNGIETLNITDSDKSFFNIIGEGSVHKADNFLKEVFSMNQSYNWELNVHLKDELYPLRFSGINTGKDCIIVAAKSNYELSSLVDYFIDQLSDLDRDLKKSLQDLQMESCKQEQRDRGLMDEITRLNNELVTVQRELSKKNYQLNQLNNDLEKRVDERTKKIKRLLKQKDDFVVQLGHDLKTPLGPIINLVPIIEQKEQDPKLKNMLSVVNKSSLKLHNLIRKITKYTYVTSTECKLDYEQVNIHDEIQQVLESKKDDCDQIGIQIDNRIDSDLTVITDRNMIHEIFNELLSNAVKFSPGGGTITIDNNDKGKTIQYSVKDTGIGLTQSQTEHIFDEFYKTDESRHDLNSHGLGLPYVKIIVEKLGGAIWIESDGLGKGSTVFFSLPKSTEL
jgi:signal transduction histidine kinase